MRKLKTKLLFPLLATCILMSGMTVSANTGIERSSTGEAFTLDRYNQNIYDGKMKEEVYFRPVTLTKTEKGQHLYAAEYTGNILISKWTLEYSEHYCIHNSYPDGNNWMGFSFGRQSCITTKCQPGWIATCAKCGREITILFYSTKDTISQIKSLTNGDCFVSNCVDPNCNNLENGAGINHKCDEISWNRYTIQYNGNGANGGYITNSYHYYNNNTVFEGKTVSPQTKLSTNVFYRTGYVFDCWNTKRDGSGQKFENEDDFLNIQNKLNLGNSDNGKVVILYAQWKPAYSTLVINPNGGSYNGETTITQRFRTVYSLDSDKLTPPTGATVSYDTQGGYEIESTHTTTHFSGWTFANPLRGMFNEKYKQYLFGAYDTNNIFASTKSDWYDGCVDTVTANYTGDSFKLPEATYPNGDNPEDQKRFGGWYADPDCTIFIGGPGDEFSTDHDITLYAKWSTLHLESEENWTANRGKGAVDLSWIQTDSSDKVFKIYQKKENENWIEVKSSTSITDDLGEVKATFIRNSNNENTEQMYIVPYSGMYDFTLNGAQGGNYGNYVGGKGGKVTGRIFLYEGEELRVGVGSQDGKGSAYTGGTASNYGTGGGGTYLYTKRLGYFAVAGGGGGATLLGNGNAANSGVYRADNAGAGENGMAGGGGGWIGGQKGTAVLHHHKENCLGTRELTRTKTQVHNSYRDDDDNSQHTYTSVAEGSKGTAKYMVLKCYFELNGAHNCSGCGAYLNAYDQNGNVFWTDYPDHLVQVGRDLWNNAIPGNEAAKNVLNRQPYETHDNVDWDSSGNAYIKSRNYYWLHRDENGVIKRYVVNNGSKDYVPTPSANMRGETSSSSKSGTDFWNTTSYSICTTIQIPSYVTYVRFELKIRKDNKVDYGSKGEISAATLGGFYNCGYTEGGIETSYPSYGGGNGYSADGTSNKVLLGKSDYASTQTGDGNAVIFGAELGIFKSNELKGIVASDETAPNTPSLKRKAVEDDNDFSKTTIIWNDPGDNGTTYQHQVKSFYAETMAPMLESNITTDVITSGVKGYRIIIDDKEDTVVTKDNSDYQTENFYAVKDMKKTETKYIHVAAVDGAGNIGETAHLKLGSNIGAQVYYPIETTPIVIKGLDDNVYKKDGSYFVKADGKTPFYLSTNGLISEVGDAVPSANYQVNALAFNVSNNGSKQKYNYYRQNDSTDIGKINIDDVTKTVSGVAENSYFGDYSYFEMSRYNNLRNISLNIAYIMDDSLNNMKLHVTPQATAYQTTDKFNNTSYTYSNDAADELNGIDLIADGKAPEISGDGYEFLKNIDNIDVGDYPDDYEIAIDVKDDESGLKEFYIVIENEDNKKTQTFTGTISDDGKNGTITINIINDDLLFQGDVNFVIYASDNVGNETEESKGLGEFGLRTQITSQTSIDTIGDNGCITFKKGETGVLIVRTSGYADQVQVKFPDDFAMSGFDTVKNYYYEKPISGGDTNEEDLRRFGVRTEIIRFPIPYDIEEKDAYDIEITAFKNGDSIVVNETVGVRTLSEHQKFNISGSLLDNLRTYIIKN